MTLKYPGVNAVFVLVLQVLVVTADDELLKNLTEANRLLEQVQRGLLTRAPLPGTNKHTATITLAGRRLA